MPQAQASLAASQLHGADRAAAGQATRTGRARAGPCAAPRASAEDGLSRDARSRGAKKCCATKASMPNSALGGEETARQLSAVRCLPSIWNWALSNIETGQMRSKIGAVPLVLVGFLLASCASPRGLDEPPLQIPALKPGYGRVYFTRPGDWRVSAVQPEIRMNNEVVGRSVPGGFSYVDRPPGKYAVTTATEIENAVTFQLAAGETKYIKTTVTPGILVGHVTPTLEFPEQGQSDISRLRYVGPKF